MREISTSWDVLRIEFEAVVTGECNDRAADIGSGWVKVEITVDVIATFERNRK